jgi:hypothetical protein
LSIMPDPTDGRDPSPVRGWSETSAVAMKTARDAATRASLAKSLLRELDYDADQPIYRQVFAFLIDEETRCGQALRTVAGWDTDA